MEYSLLTKPVLFVHWNEGCNDTRNHAVEEEILIQPLLASLAILAFILNGLALFIFCYQRTRSIMRFNLILLSTAECLFNLMIIVLFLQTLTNISTVRIKIGSSPEWWRIEIAPRVYKITIILIDVMVCLRNWCNLVIAASRAEVLSVAFGKKKFFKKSTICVIISFMGVTASVLAVIRNMDSELLICLNGASRQYFSEQKYHLRFVLFNIVTKIWFLVQCIVPWVGVMVSSIIMTVALCSKLKAGNSLVTGVGKGQRQKNTNTALRTVFGLALTFTLCEMPSFIFIVISEVDISGMEKIKNFINVSNSLIGLDSVCNFCVYAASMPYFREQVLRLIKCRGLGPRKGRNIYAASNYPFAKYNSKNLLLKKQKDYVESPTDSNESPNDTKV